MRSRQWNMRSNSSCSRWRKKTRRSDSGTSRWRNSNGISDTPSSNLLILNSPQISWQGKDVDSVDSGREDIWSQPQTSTINKLSWLRRMSDSMSKGCSIQSTPTPSSLLGQNQSSPLQPIHPIGIRRRIGNKHSRMLSHLLIRMGLRLTVLQCSLVHWSKGLSNHPMHLIIGLRVRNHREVSDPEVQREDITREYL